MSNIHKLGASVGKATPAPTQNPIDNFFQQLIPVPGAIQGSVNVIAAPGSGIPIRDFFAAQALATCRDSHMGGEPDTVRGVAAWCYRIADAMITERARSAHKDTVVGFPPIDSDYVK